MDETIPRNGAPADGSETFLDLPVTEVMILEDRATVIRRGGLDLEAGRRVLRIRGVAPAASDRSLAARVTDGDLAVTEARVERSFRVLPEHRPEDVAALEARLEELERRDRDLADAVSHLGRRSTLLGALADRSLDDMVADAAWGRSPAADMVENARNLEEEILKSGDDVMDLTFEQEDLAVLRQDLLVQRHHRERPDTGLEASIVLVVEATAAARVEIEVRYLVPGACWRPQYRARLSGDHLHVERWACIWQNTGESWDPVALRLSTQRSARPAAPPRLRDDALTLEPQASEVVVEEREQVIETSGLGGEPAKILPEVPGIDDAGTVETLVLPGRHAIPSDGRPHLVPATTDLETSTRLRRVLVPELAPVAFFLTEALNGSDRSLLAGPVELVRDSGPVGRTTLGYAAPGERFRLTWGADPEIRVKRIEEVLTTEAGMLGSWDTRTITVRLHLSNIGREIRTVELCERIPVSEIEKVRVEFDPRATTGEPAGPDENGFLTWSVELPPNTPRNLVLRYSIAQHRHVKGLPA